MLFFIIVISFSSFSLIVDIWLKLSIFPLKHTFLFKRILVSEVLKLTRLSLLMNTDLSLFEIYEDIID